MAKPNFKSDEVKDVKQETSLGTEAVSPAQKTETTTSTSVEQKSSSSDDVSSEISKFHEETKKKDISSVTSDRDNKKSKYNKNKSKNKNNQKFGPSRPTDKPKSEKGSFGTTQNATSSVVTKTVTNELSNFNLASTKARLITSGWIDRIDGLSIFQQLENLFRDMGINSASLLSYRGDLLKNFSDWEALLKARPNKSIPVYVVDETDADKSLSSETIFDNFFKQRRPFSKAYSGVPVISAKMLPDQCFNLKLINVSTNGHGPSLDSEVAKYAAYGRLEQQLGQTNGYQTRRVRLVQSQGNDKGFISTAPNLVKFFKVPSTNNNGIGVSYQHPTTESNKLSVGNINLFSNGAPTIEGPINMSLELNNKAKFMTKLFRTIQSEAVNYAKKQNSGDNAWFNPIYLIEDDATLAATINGLADLKTMLYIINDAIMGAMSSQLIKATKTGTPDSNYIAITGKSTYYKNEYSSQFSKLWSHFTNIPMHKDVIDKWNQYKHWSKFSDNDLYDHDNMFMIPMFMLSRSGGGYYNENFELVEYTNTDDIPALQPTSANIQEALTLSIQTLDKAQYAIPQGDACALFIQTVFGKLSLSSFIRTGRSNQKYCFNNKVFDTTTALLNADQITERFINEMDRIEADRPEDNVNSPTRVIISQTGTNGQPSTPMIVGTDNPSNIQNSDVTNRILTNIANGKNVFGDLLVSNHTMTGFMAAFMDVIVTGIAQGGLSSWITFLESVDPYFARLSEVAPKGESISFGDVIPAVAINNLPKPVERTPEYSRDQNIDFFYQSTPFTAARGFSYTPTRINYMSANEFNAYSSYPYKAIGARYVIINHDGKADRDVTKDNTLITIEGKNNVKNFKGQNVKGCSHYLVSWSVIRLNEFMEVQFTKGTGNSMFPVYIGSHVSEMFISQTNLFEKTSSYPMVSQLNPRGLVVNTSDEITISELPGAWDYQTAVQILENGQTFIEKSGVLVPNVWYNLHAITAETTYNLFYTYRIMTQYHNNGSVNVTDYLVDFLFKRWSLESDYIPATTFATL